MEVAKAGEYVAGREQLVDRNIQVDIRTFHVTCKRLVSSCAIVIGVRSQELARNLNLRLRNWSVLAIF